MEISSGNVKELDALFSQLPGSDIFFYMRYVYDINKNIKGSVLEWLVHKINIPQFLEKFTERYYWTNITPNLKLLGLIYYHYPDTIKSFLNDNPMAFFNLTQLPIVFYVQCQLGNIFNYPEMIKKKATGFTKVKYNEENMDILAVILSKREEKIGKKTTKKMAQEIITKLKNNLK